MWAQVAKGNWSSSVTHKEGLSPSKRAAPGFPAWLHSQLWPFIYPPPTPIHILTTAAPGTKQQLKQNKYYTTNLQINKL